MALGLNCFSCFTKVAKLANPPIFLDSLIQGAIRGKDAHANHWYGG